MNLNHEQEGPIFAESGPIEFKFSTLTAIVPFVSSEQPIKCRPI